MPTTAPRTDPHCSDVTEHPREQTITHLTLLERARVADPAPSRATTSHAPGAPVCAADDGADAANGFPARIRQLIELQGSVTAVAGRCGFSEGAVRSWRDGHSDISRERCTIIARRFGISLAWLVAGERTMRTDTKEVTHAAPIATPASRLANGNPASPPASELDSGRLAASLRLLQSYVGLVGGSLDPAPRAHLLADLYEILGDADDGIRTDRLVAFHGSLRDQLRRNRTVIA